MSWSLLEARAATLRDVIKMERAIVVCGKDNVSHTHLRRKGDSVVQCPYAAL